MRISFRNSLYFTLAGGIAVLLLVYDWIRVAVNLNSAFLTGLNDLLSIAMFALFYWTFRSFLSRKLHGPLETLRKLVGFAFFTAALLSIFGILLAGVGGEGEFIPRNVWQLIATTVFSFGVAAFLAVLLNLTSNLMDLKPDKRVRRRFGLFLCFAFAASVLSVFKGSTLMGTLGTIAFVITVVIATSHIVSMNWIVFLTRKEKYKSLVHTLFLFLLCGYSFASAGPAHLAGGILQFYSGPLDEFAKISFLFMTIYFSLAFVVTLFHIPTSGVFEKKKRELDSYQDLSKVITNVLDTTEVLNNTVTVVGTVTQANKVWIELRNDGTLAGPGDKYEISATHKTSQYELSAFDFSAVREAVAARNHVIVNDSAELARFSLKEFPAKSLLAVPLTAHDEFIGVLYASHDMPYAFDEEETSTVSAFADTAAVAIQNSLLFTKSIENERLQHELRIAHEMQLKLLPESLPYSEKFETDFLSFPALEVGGDYIDYSRIADGTYAFVVGDVSGKGTSAAFYMAYMKGVFQSLSASLKSPLEFMMEANDAIENTLQKNFFITLIYVLLREKEEELSIVRAGHMPGVLISGGVCRLIKPAGAGLGLEPSKDFGKHIEEEKICLKRGDTLVLYTDGVTDQRNPEGEEFGEERFYGLLKETSGGSATDIKGGIIRALAEFSQGTDAVDDTTVLILKWKGIAIPD